MIDPEEQVRSMSAYMNPNAQSVVNKKAAEFFDRVKKMGQVAWKPIEAVGRYAEALPPSVDPIPNSIGPWGMVDNLALLGLKSVGKVLKAQPEDVVRGMKGMKPIANIAEHVAKEVPPDVYLKEEAFKEILKKHPDAKNLEFNKAKEFINTLDLPDRVNELTGKQRVNFIKKLTDKYEGFVNKVVTKPVVADNKTYMNTSFITNEPHKIKKYLSEGRAVPSSPIGVEARMSTSANTKDIIPFSKEDLQQMYEEVKKEFPKSKVNDTMRGPVAIKSPSPLQGLAGEARKYKSAEEFANNAEGLATRMGKVKTKTGGQYFSTKGQSTYFDPMDMGPVAGKKATGFEGRNNYDISSAKLAEADTPDAIRVMEKALKDPSNTPQDIIKLRRDVATGSIDYHIADEIPSVVKAAKKLGYDGLKVWESDDIGNPSSVVLWNTKIAKQIGNVQDFYNQARGGK